MAKRQAIRSAFGNEIGHLSKEYIARSWLNFQDTRKIRGTRPASRGVREKRLSASAKRQRTLRLGLEGNVRAEFYDARTIQIAGPRRSKGRRRDTSTADIRWGNIRS